MPFEEAKKSREGDRRETYYEDSLKESQAFREDYKKMTGVIKAAEMPWEESRQGLIKHMVNEKMKTTECAIDLYQQVLSPGGKSGKHRHMSEELIYVLEGSGYDLHWDVRFDCIDTYIWDWEKEPKKFAWEEGDYVYIPPYTTHQHVNADPDKPARFVSASNRIVKALGFNWMEQVEPAPDYKEGKNV